MMDCNGVLVMDIRDCFKLAEITSHNFYLGFILGALSILLGYVIGTYLWKWVMRHDT